MPSVTTSRAIARPTSKLLLASPLQTMSRSVVLPDRNAADVMLPHHFREFGDRGVGADPVDTLVHHVFDFHGGPPLLEFQVHLMQCNTAPVFSTIQPIGCDDTSASKSQKKYHSYAIGQDKRRRCSCHLPAFDSDFAARVPAEHRRQWAARIRREARAVNSGFTKALCAMTSVCGNRVARAQGGIAKRILRAKSTL